MPVWISFRIPQFRGDPVFKRLGDEVLQPFRFIVNLVPRIVQEIVEETFQQTVVPTNLEC